MRFHVGQIVRPSEKGIAANLFDGTYRGSKRSEQSGRVVKVDLYGFPTVQWRGRKTSLTYAPHYLALDTRTTRRKRWPRRKKGLL